jgi:hypothetical protein
MKLIKLNQKNPMSCGSQEDFHQNGYLINSSRRFRYNPRLLFFSSNQISIDQTGPFWPIGFPIKYPPPLYLSRTANVQYSNEYYHILDTNNRQTYDNQPAIYKYTESLKHSVIVYDMEKSTKQQKLKTNDNEHICPQLIFESRFEGGNLRQVKRV